MRFRQVHGWQGLEPHITVKAPCGLGEQAAWLPAVRQLCQHIEAFSIEVGGVGTFESAVLFLQVLSPALLTLHHRLLRELYISYADQETCFEGLRYTPHLTLTHWQTANNAFDSKAISAATDYFPEQTLFRASELVVYGKTEANAYQVIETFPFRNSSLVSSLVTSA